MKWYNNFCKYQPPFLRISIYLILFLNCSNCVKFKGKNSTTEGVSDYDQTIYDADYPEYADNVDFDFIVNKCNCDLGQIWDGQQCLESEESVLSSLYVLNQYFIELYNISNYFKVQNINCTTNVLRIVPSLTGDNIFISDYGELYYQEGDTVISATDFCLEFFAGDNGVQLEVHVCVPHLNIPKCCQNNQSCLNNFVSTASLGNHRVNVGQTDFIDSAIPQCHNGGKLTKFILSNNADSETGLHFRSGVTDLLWNPGKYYTKPQIFTVDEYCITEEDDSTPAAMFCYLDPMVEHQMRCNNSICVRKCCQQNQFFDVPTRKCSKGNNLPPFFEKINFYNSQTRDMTTIPSDIVMEYSFPWCANGSYLIDPSTNPKDEVFLLNDGNLFITLSDVAVPPKHYCIENFIDGNFSAPKVISCFLANEEKDEDRCKIVHEILYPILLVISCIFLCITLMVYASIPELHAKLHGKSLISHVSSLLGAFVCQLIVSWSSSSLSMVGCQIIGLANQVTFLWAFFWLNVMCFDIWWTLKTMSPRPETGENTRRRFVYYSIYAWGTPAVVCIVTAIMEFLPASVDSSHLLLPGFGVRGCWFQDMYSTWLYFHGLTLFLYVTNILFFFHVAAILIKEQRSTEGILRPTWKQHKERVWLYLKLFVVMGITWICEVASWQEGTCEYWIFTDIVNSLQGVFIFFIFMCNRKVFQKIHSKGLPLFQSAKKSLFKFPRSSRRLAHNSGESASSRRTTGTSVESSSRRLSSSLQPSLNALNLDTIKEKKASEQKITTTQSSAT